MANGNASRRRRTWNRGDQSQACPDFLHLSGHTLFRLFRSGVPGLAGAGDIRRPRPVSDFGSPRAERDGASGRRRSALARAPAGSSNRFDGQPVRTGICKFQHEGKDQVDRAGDDGQPAPRTGHDPLVGLGLSRVFASSRISRCWPAFWAWARGTPLRKSSPAPRRWCCRCLRCLSASSRCCATMLARGAVSLSPARCTSKPLSVDLCRRLQACWLCSIRVRRSMSCWRRVSCSVRASVIPSASYAANCCKARMH